MVRKQKGKRKKEIEEVKEEEEEEEEEKKETFVLSRPWVDLMVLINTYEDSLFYSVFYILFMYCHLEWC